MILRKAMERRDPKFSDLRAAFDAFDSDKSGSIDLEELKNLCEAANIPPAVMEKRLNVPPLF